MSFMEVGALFVRPILYVEDAKFEVVASFGKTGLVEEGVSISGAFTDHTSFMERPLGRCFPFSQDG